MNSVVGGKQRFFAPRAPEPEGALVKQISADAGYEPDPHRRQGRGGRRLLLAGLLHHHACAGKNQGEAYQRRDQPKSRPARIMARRWLQRAEFGKGNSVRDFHWGYSNGKPPQSQVVACPARGKE